MAGEVVNLRRERKRRDRAAEAAQAADNRVAFGRLKSERRAAEAETGLSERRLDGHRREAPDPADAG